MSKKTRPSNSDEQISESIGTEQLPDVSDTLDLREGGVADRMAHARAARQGAIRDGRQRRPNLLYVVETDSAGKLGRVVRAFANKYRLRKWLSVASDIDPSLPARVAVIRGRQHSLESMVE